MVASGKRSRSIFLDPPWLWIAVFFLLLLLLLAILFPGSLLAQDLPRVKKGVVRITAQVEGKTRVGAGIIVKWSHVWSGRRSSPLSAKRE